MSWPGERAREPRASPTAGSTPSDSSAAIRSATSRSCVATPPDLCPPRSGTRRRCASASSSSRSATPTASPARSRSASFRRSAGRSPIAGAWSRTSFRRTRRSTPETRAARSPTALPAWIGINTAVAGVGLGSRCRSTRRRSDIISALISDGRVRRALLGIAGGPRPLPPKLRDRYTQDSGVEVVDVIAGSAAEASGIRPGDLVWFGSTACPCTPRATSSAS